MAAEAAARPTFSAIVDAAELDGFVETITTLNNVGEARIHATDNGLEARVVEPANVCMVETWLEPDAFESYEAADETLGVNLERLQDVLSFAGSGSLARLQLDPETRKLTIEVDHRTFRLALIDPDAIRKEPDIPELDEERPATATLEGGDLVDDVKASAMLSDHLDFRAFADPMRLEVVAKGDNDDLEAVYHNEDAIALHVPDGEAVQSLVSVDYLKEIVKPIAADAEVRLQLGEEYPVRFAYDREHGGAVYELAPRIQNT